jgi:hypothetical protein
MEIIGGRECNTLVLILGSVLFMYMMNGYKLTNVNCNETLYNNKMHHQQQNIRAKRMGIMTPQEEKNKGA